MGSSCSGPTSLNTTMEILPTIEHPTNPDFQLSTSGAINAQKQINKMFDANGNGEPIIKGWTLKQDRQIAGKSVFENKYTGERIPWIPLQSASKDKNASWDILHPCAHFNWTSSAVSLEGLDIEIDDDGHLGVVDVFEDCPWKDAGAALNYYITMVNGMPVPKIERMISFETLLKESYRKNGSLHVLFSVSPAIKYQGYLQLSGLYRELEGNIDSYGGISGFGGLSME